MCPDCCWSPNYCWAEAPVKIARKTLTIKLDRNWSSFQLANNTPPLSVTGSVIAPSARILLEDVKVSGPPLQMMRGMSPQCHLSYILQCNISADGEETELDFKFTPSQLGISVTPKGVLLLAMCDASATHEVP